MRHAIRLCRQFTTLYILFSAPFMAAAPLFESMMLYHAMQAQQEFVDLASYPDLLEALYEFFDHVDECGPALQRLEQLIDRNHLHVPVWLLKCAGRELYNYAAAHAGHRAATADLTTLADALSNPLVPLSNIYANTPSTSTPIVIKIGSQWSHETGGTQRVDIGMLERGSTQNSTVNIANADATATGLSSVNIAVAPNSQVTIGSASTSTNIPGTVTIGSGSIIGVVAPILNNNDQAQTILFNNVPSGGVNSKTLTQGQNSASATNAGLAVTLMGSYGIDARSLTINMPIGATRTVTGQILTIGSINGTFDAGAAGLTAADVIANTGDVFNFALFTPTTNATTGKGRVNVQQMVTVGQFSPVIAGLGGDPTDIVRSTLNLGRLSVAAAVPGASIVESVINLGTSTTVNGVSTITIGSTNTGSLTTLLGNVIANSINNTNVVQTINFNNIPAGGTSNKTLNQAMNNASATDADLTTTLTANYGIDVRSVTFTAANGASRAVTGQTLAIAGVTGTFNVSADANPAHVLTFNGDTTNVGSFTPIAQTTAGAAKVELEQIVNVGLFMPDITALMGSGNTVQSTLNIGTSNVTSVVPAGSTVNAITNIGTTATANGTSVVAIGSNNTGSTTTINGTITLGGNIIANSINNTNIAQTINFNNVPVGGTNNKTLNQAMNNASATDADLTTILTANYGVDARSSTIDVANAASRTVTLQTLTIGSVTGTFNATADANPAHTLSFTGVGDTTNIASFTPIAQTTAGQATVNLQQLVNVGLFMPDITGLNGSGNIVQSTLNLGTTTVAAVPAGSTVNSITNVGTTANANGTSMVAIGSTNTGSTTTVNGVTTTLSGNVIANSVNNTNIAQTINFNNIPVGGTSNKVLNQANNNSSATDADLTTTLNANYGIDARSVTFTAANGASRTVTGQTLAIAGVTGTFNVSADANPAHTLTFNGDTTNIASFTPVAQTTAGQAKVDLEQTVNVGAFTPDITGLNGSGNTVQSTLNLGTTTVAAVPAGSTVNAITNIGTTANANGTSTVTIGSTNTGSTNTLLGNVIALSVNNIDLAQTINFNNIPLDGTANKTLTQAQNSASATNAALTRTLTASYGRDARALTINATSGLTRTVTGQTLTVGGISGTFDASNASLISTDKINNNATVFTFAPFIPTTNSTTGAGTVSVQQTVNVGQFAPVIAGLGGDPANVVQSTLNLGVLSVANPVPGTSTVNAVTNLGTSTTIRGVSTVTIGSTNTGSTTSILGNAIALTLNNTNVAQTINFNNVPAGGTADKTLTQAQNNASATDANLTTTLTANYGVDARSSTIDAANAASRTVTLQTLTLGSVTGTFDATADTNNTHSISFTGSGDTTHISSFMPVAQTTAGQAVVNLRQVVNVGLFNPNIAGLNGSGNTLQSTLNVGTLNIANAIPAGSTANAITNVGTTETVNGTSMVTIGSTNTGSTLSLLSPAAGLTYQEDISGTILYPIGSTTAHAVEIFCATFTAVGATWNTATVTNTLNTAVTRAGSTATTLRVNCPANYTVVNGTAAGTKTLTAVPTLATNTITFTTTAPAAGDFLVVVVFAWKT